MGDNDKKTKAKCDFVKKIKNKTKGKFKGKGYTFCLTDFFST